MREVGRCRERSWTAIANARARGLLSSACSSPRTRVGTASTLGGVVLLVLTLAGCSGSGSAGRAPGGPAGMSTPAASTERPPAGGAQPPTSAGAGSSAVPEPAHTVVVVLENHSYTDIVGNPAAPFINSLARRGALFTSSYAVTHPSEPNYLALFSGSTQGVTDDGCPYRFTAPNLATDLTRSGKSFAGYAEGLPGPGSPVCSAGDYARKHVPWAYFSSVPGSVSLPFTSFPAAAFARLPTVSFVIPDLCHDMHDCSIGVGDAWLAAHIGGYADWAMSHDSLLIVTFDEDDHSAGNHIPTVFVGQQVRPGRYAEPVTHYGVLATIEAAYALPREGQADTASPITNIWR